MYFTEIDEREFGVKPMNCPGHHLLFRSKHWSYRDLPVRYADFGRLHRYERSGVTAGLTRVRTFSQDDSHIYAPPEKVEDEIFRFIDFLDAVYGTFGFDEVDISLGTRPPQRIGSDEDWDMAEAALETRAAQDGPPLRRHAGRRQLLRPEDRLPRQGRDRPAVAARDDAVRLRAAGALRPDVRRGGRQGPPPGRSAPRDPRLGRAVPGHPDRAHGRQLSLLDRAGPGGRPAGLGPLRREPPGRPPRACRPPACGSRSTSATKSSARGSAGRSFRRSRACSSSARRKRPAVRCPSGSATAGTRARCR